MPDCDHCGASFDEEQPYLEHLAEAHWDDLGPIDRRRVEEAVDAEEQLISRRVALLGAGGLGLAVVGGAGLFLSGGNDDGSAGAPTPHAVGSVHYHGTMVVAVDGQRVDFSRDEYQLQADFFHFEGGDGERWHAHAQGVTLKRALASLGIGVTETTLTLDGTTYDDADPDTSVSVTVDGESVDPATYVLQEGDEVRIIVETGG